MKTQPDIAYLRECFVCDPSAGTLHWRTRPREHFGSDLAFVTSNAKYAGIEALSTNSKGYRRDKLSFNGVKKEFLVHRIIWAMVSGCWPKAMIDHRNTDHLDNRFANLRSATNAENMRNMGAYRSNKLGIKGVFAVRDKFRAEIRDSSGRRVRLGDFSTQDEASEAYRSAALEYHGEFARTQ